MNIGLAEFREENLSPEFSGVKMASGDRKFPERTSLPSSPPTPNLQANESITKRVLITTLLGGIFGGGAGLFFKNRKAHPNIPTVYATNCAIVAGCYCVLVGAREFVRVTRKAEQDDLMNSAIGGLFSGALLGRLQGGPQGAMRYSLVFAAVGTAFDYACLKAKPLLESYNNMESFKLPEWSPIKILDEEALAKKKAQEQKIFSERVLGRLNKEDS